jgi:DNA polymerase V
MFALVDCNNFYCSCERVFNPSLKGRPLIVLSNNDGCAIARSDEAKALGIKMGTPAFMIEKLIEQHHIAVFSSNYTLYGDMSERVMATLKSFAPRMEVYSIDEAFLDVSHLKYQDLEALGKEIKKTVKQYTGIPVSVGIAPTKTLAKMANRYAKKTNNEVGVYLVDTAEKIAEVLRFTDIADVWGVGSERSKKFHALGITKAYDLLGMNDEWMREHMTVTGQRMLNELKGISCVPLEETPPAKQNICTSKSFGELQTALPVLKEAVATYAANCAYKLRQQKCCAGAVQVFLQTNPFRKEDKQYSNSITLPIPVATSNTQEIMFYALAGLARIYRKGYNYLKAGVVLMKVVPEDQVQQGLYDKRERLKEKYVIDAVDSVNKSFGREMLKWAVQGSGRKWKLKMEHKSPCYTTRLADIKTIQI